MIESNYSEVKGDYLHHSGTVYTVQTVTNLHAHQNGWPVTVVYIDKSNRVWSRPIEDFLNSCKPIAN